MILGLRSFKVVLDHFYYVKLSKVLKFNQNTIIGYQTHNYFHYFYYLRTHFFIILQMRLKTNIKLLVKFYTKGTHKA